MELIANESDEYLPSDDSDDFSDEDVRTNRWHGPKSTWQQFNHQEIDTLTALKEIRDRDLSVHLYNAFALKQGHKKAQDGPVPNKDINKATGHPVQPDDWLPQRAWTAWPMRVDKVPPPQDSARTLLNDRDEVFTLRKAVRDMPSTALEEIVGAEILRTAKEKFNARPWIKPDVSADEEGGSESQEGINGEDSDGETEASTASRRKESRSRSRSKSVKLEGASGDEKMEVDGRKPETDATSKPHRKPRFAPTVSTDDDLSYSLLRPSVRHILTKLDATLTILHNTQESALNYQSDSADSEASDSSHPGSRKSRSRPGSQAPTDEKRRRGRPLGSLSQNRSRGRSEVREATAAAAVAAEETAPQTEEQEKPARKRGRPKKAYPRLDGETDREYTIRIARLQKKPIPKFSDEPAERAVAEEEDPAGDSGNSGDAEETAAEAARGHLARRKKNKKKEKEANNKASRSPSQASSASGGKPRNAQRSGHSRTRLGLRDWRDVLGAAALAGFPADAVDRAARRCADLFGQSMTLHTLPEGPAASSSGRKAPLGRATTYVPGMPRPPLLDEEEEEEEGEGEKQQRRIRATSMAAPSATSEDEAGPSRTGGGARSCSRSRSVSAAPGYFTCSFPDCPRAAAGEGFLRRYNMLRHMKLVHGYTAGAGAASERGSGDEAAAGTGVGTGTAMGAGMPEEMDSEDEMYGAVHVDWFLRPIKIRRGWRANDIKEDSRTRRSGYGRARGRSRGREGDTGGKDGDGDTRMGE
ncbi:uncharacterized protein F4812DRAFT_463075 [Daldinia caldariorum]|uniref:uncharacterized protein n=1 Tax=Daldinia caldariorum TaxID=326644 RepID=UPI0020083D95|nr:uncharacterized protein F4812DRAFT_463075 [Daldinia caldariorum]KAI1464018.1 hypothetical protein F4812DRAFT_463075 [Daldinia caldariorum]